MSKMHDKRRIHYFIHIYLQTGKRRYLQLSSNNLQFIQGFTLTYFL